MNESHQLPIEPEPKAKKNILNKAIRATLIGVLKPFFRKEERLNGTAYVSRITVGKTPLEFFIRSEPGVHPSRTTYRIKQ